MPLAKKSVRRVGGRRRRVARKPMRIMRKARVAGRSGIAEYASLSVKRSLALPGGGNYGANVLYSLMNTTLADFPRAVQVAQAYQFYRIKRITLTFKPSYDAYNSALGAVTKPRLYWMIDKSGTIPTNIALEGLKAMGARPFEIDESPRVVSWAPSVLNAAFDAAGPDFAQYRIHPWLNTTDTPLQPGVFVPSSIDHLGIYWWMDQLNNPQGQLYQVECEVQFQFKKPLTNILSTVSAVPATFAVVNNSPNGIVDASGNGVYNDDHLAT